MGQKVHPIGFRLGYIQKHKAIWYASKKDFSRFLREDFEIREYLYKTYTKAMLSTIYIERKGNKITITIDTARPGVLIGKKGEDIDKIKATIKKISGLDAHVVAREIKHPDLDARVVATSIAQQIEKRVMYKRAVKKAMHATSKARAQGIKIQVSGRLGGAEIARTEHQKIGRIPLHTLRADIDYFATEALTTYGIIGIKVWIYKGNANKFVAQTK